MKRLILLRHGKAQKLGTTDSDFVRKLEARGFEEVTETAHQLKKAGYTPECIVSSTAARTRSTAETMLKELKLQPDILQFETLLYMADIHAVKHVIHELHDSFQTAMIVGHNPSITAMVGYLTPTFAEHVPTSGIVVVEFPAEQWKMVQAKTGNIVWHGAPGNKKILLPYT